MSRVGKKLITIPEKTEVSYKDKTVTIKGKLGTLSRTIHNDIDIEISDNSVKVIPLLNNKKVIALQGMTRSLINNMVIGVTKGFQRILQINGIGYRAESKSNSIKLTLGYSHPIDYPLPEGISAEVDKQNNITIKGIDNELLGQTAANIRKLRPPEPYKGKGVKYAEEFIQRKAGKSGAK